MEDPPNLTDYLPPELPQPAGTWGITGTLLFGLLIAVVFVIAQTLAGILYIMFFDIPVTEEAMAGLLYDGDFLCLATLFSTVSTVPLTLLLIKLKAHATVKDYLALHPVSFKTLGKWLGALLVLIVMTDGTSYLLGKPIVVDFMTRSMRSTVSPVLLILCLTVMPPLAEEIFFRGFLYAGLSRSFLKPGGAVAVTSVLFAAIHTQYDFYTMSTIFFAGLLMGMARYKTGSLWVPILIHAAMNLIASLQTLAVLNWF